MAFRDRNWFIGAVESAQASVSDAQADIANPARGPYKVKHHLSLLFLQDKVAIQ